MVETCEPRQKILLTIDNFRQAMVGVSHLFEIARELRGVKIGQTHGRLSYSGVMRMASAHRVKEVFADTEFSKDEQALMALDVQDVVRSSEAHIPHCPDYISIMMSAGRKAIKEAAKHKGPAKLILKANSPAMTEVDCRRIYGRSRIDNTLEAARIAIECGVDGILCSGLAVKKLRKMEENEFDADSRLLVIAAAVRMPDDPEFRRGRHISPYDALEGGADILGIGRAITEDRDPEAKTSKIIASIS
jgi:hypothetical protein